MFVCRLTVALLILALFADRGWSGEIGQVGANDFRISDMDGAPFVGITGPGSVAFNTLDREYLVVWSGTATPSATSEIYGQRLDRDGSPVGAPDFRISQLSQGNPSFGAFSPSVVYNPHRREYLVVWYGQDFLLPDNGNEIYAQRLRPDGSSLGGNFRISQTGDGTAIFDAFNPVATYNGNDFEYLVVWYADHGQGALVNNEFEIYGQFLDAVGVEIGSDFRISEMGGSGDPSDAAFEPDVAFDPINGWYLVVWTGDAAGGALVDDEFEIYGQLLDATGQQIGTNDFLLSDLGGFGDADFDAGSPAVEFQPVTREWWVVWFGDDDEGGLVEGELEIFGQRLSIAGAQLGDNDFRISTMGGLGAAGFFAFVPDLVFDSSSDEMLVAWSGNEQIGETEIHLARLRADGLLADRSIRISDLGPDADPSFFAEAPALAWNEVDGQLLVVWWGNDDQSAGVASDVDIFGQRLTHPFFCDGFESGDFAAWSQVTP